MNRFAVLFVLLLPVILALPGCKQDDIKKDTAKIGDAMCRNIDVMGRLRMARPDDTAAINALQAEVRKIQEEMTGLYKEFNKKYGNKVNDIEFSREFSRELRKTMLDNCRSLSKQDREQFEKDLEK